MKSNLTKLSLALLFVVFILGCQDQGPVGPDALVPQFDKRGTGDCAPPSANVHCHGDEPPPPEDATFTANFTADVSGVATPLFGPHSGKKNLQGGGPHQPPVLLGFSALLQTADGYSSEEGANCFPEANYSVNLSLGQNKPGSSEAIIRIFFTGKDKVNGDTDIGYELLLRGTLDPAEWVPATVDDIATITGGTFGIGAGGQQACNGTGVVDFNVDVVLNPPA